MNNTIRRLSAGFLFRAKSPRQEIDHPSSAARVQERRHGAKALGHVPSGFMRGDVPVITGRVFHARFAVSISLIDWTVQGGGASFERALVNGIRIFHVKV